jgi:transposase
MIRCVRLSDVEKYCPDSLWHLAQPLLPEHPKRHQGGGRRRIDDRTALAAIIYVLQTGCPWDALPASFPISSKTAHRRFSQWVHDGVMQALHQAMLDLLGAAGQIDWSRAAVDSMHVRAVKGGT